MLKATFNMDGVARYMKGSRYYSEENSLRSCSIASRSVDPATHGV